MSGITLSHASRKTMLENGQKGGPNSCWSYPNHQLGQRGYKTSFVGLRYSFLRLYQYSRKFWTNPNRYLMDEMGWPGPFSVTVTALWAYWFTGYQVFMAEHLKPAQRLEYLNFGHAFMSSFYNMQRSAFQYALLHWSICQDPVYEEWWKPNPSSFIIDERNEVFLLLFSMEVQIGNCT